MKKILVVLFLLLCLTGCATEQIYIPEDFEVVNKEAAFVFPEVSEGICTIVDVFGGECILVGCGSTEDFPILYEILRKREIEEITAIVLQTDTPECVGGLGKILSNFKVSRVYACEYIQDKDKYRALCRNNSEEECSFTIAVEGTRIYDENELVIDVISSDMCYGLGTLSVYAVFGDKAIFFDGATDSDAAEDIIATAGENIASDVFVVSSPLTWTSTHKELLQRTKADFLVTNSGGDFASADTLAGDAKETGATLKRTDANGKVSIVTDGKKIKCYTER